jgi:hypothetical protein
MAGCGWTLFCRGYAILPGLEQQRSFMHNNSSLFIPQKKKRNCSAAGAERFCRFPLSIVRTPQSRRHAERNFFSLYSQISLCQIFSRKLSKFFQKSLYNMPENRILLRKSLGEFTEAMQFVSIFAE